MDLRIRGQARILDQAPTNWYAKKRGTAHTAPPSYLRSVVGYAACRLASQHGRLPFLQHAAPVMQQDDATAAGLQQSPLTNAVGGILPLPQQAAPASQQVAPCVQHDTEADFAPFILGHLSPQHPPFPAL